MDELERRSLIGQEFDAFVERAGEPDEYWDIWTYSLGSAGLGVKGEVTYRPRHATTPVLYVAFDPSGSATKASTSPITASDYLPFDSQTWLRLAGADRESLALTICRDQLIAGLDKPGVQSQLGSPDFQEKRAVFYCGQHGSDPIQLFVDLSDDGKIQGEHIYFP